jgi:hypothetical protein
MKNINCPADFNIAQLVDYMADAGAQVGHMERITVCTSTQRITLYVGVAAIEDVSPKVTVVK